VTHFPVDAPKVKVIKAFELLGSQYLIAFFLAPSFYFAVLRKTGSLLSSL